jgi:hypothetical protein
LSAAIRRKSKDWLARNQNNVSEWSDMENKLIFNDMMMRSALFYTNTLS